MRDKTRRLQSIEVSLTPRQLVLLWFSRAQQTGNFATACTQMPLPRSTLANAVYNNVRRAMKGQTESLIDQAIRQARQEADQLYILLFEINRDILTSRKSRLRESLFLLGHLQAFLEFPVRHPSFEVLRTSTVTA
jgi:hypothetical protein